MRGLASRRRFRNIGSRRCGFGQFRDNRPTPWQLSHVAKPNDPMDATHGTLPTTADHHALEQELERAVKEIERGECIVLTAEQVDRWVETGVPPWPEDFPD